MKKIATIILISALAGCSTKESARVELHIPLLSECIDIVNRAKAHLIDTSANKSYKLDIELVNFDEAGNLYEGPVGMATLVSIGEWQPLDGSTPLDYLRLTASGIFASCSASNSLTIKFEDNPELSARELASIAQSKGVKNISISSEQVIIKFNDGSYVYPF